MDSENCRVLLEEATLSLKPLLQVMQEHYALFGSGVFLSNLECAFQFSNDYNELIQLENIPLGFSNAETGWIGPQQDFNLMGLIENLDDCAVEQSSLGVWHVHPQGCSVRLYLIGDPSFYEFMVSKKGSELLLSFDYLLRGMDATVFPRRMETALNSNEPFYSSIMQSAVDPIIVIDVKGHILDCNEATLDTFWYERDELINQSVNILIPQDLASLHDGFINNYLSSRQGKIIGSGREVLAKRKNGSEFYCYLAVNHVEIDGEHYFTGLLRNIDQQKKYEQLLEDQIAVVNQLNNWKVAPKSGLDETIQTLLEILAQGTECHLISLNLFNGSVALNHCIETGYSHDQITSDSKEFVNQLDWVNSEQLSIFVNPLTLLNSPKSPLVVSRLISMPVFSHQQWQGNIDLFWFNASLGKPFSLNKEILLSFANALGNYLEIYWALDQLKVANNRFQRSQDYANIGTWDWDIQSGSLYWSDRIAPLFGYRRGELETSYDNFLYCVHPDDREKVQNAVNACINEGVHYDIDHRIVWPDGSVRWVNEKGDVARDANGKPLKMLGVVQDIQRAKEAEDRLEVARLSAEKANRAKSEFLSMVSHELRTPLNSILGFTQLLEMEKLSNDQQLYLKRINDSGQLLLDLVNDVLDLARIDSGTVETCINAINLCELIGHCIDLMSYQTNRKKIKLNFDREHATCIVKGDYLRLKQVIINLLSNAIKYNLTNGRIDIRLVEEKSGSVRLSIQDTGIGIEESKHGELFQPFSRLGMANSSIEGIGIGLVITKRLVESMNGSIGFESRKGEGATFWVDMPSSEIYPVEKSISSGKVNLQITSRMKILYIEDSLSNIELLRSVFLKQRAIQFLEARNGSQGVSIAKALKPELIILDINLPEMDGYEVSRQLKSLPTTKNIPIIALTADEAKEADRLQNNRRFYKVLFKPLNLYDLIEVVNAIARQQGEKVKPLPSRKQQ